MNRCFPNARCVDEQVTQKAKLSLFQELQYSMEQLHILSSRRFCIAGDECIMLDSPDFFASPIAAKFVVVNSSLFNLPGSIFSCSSFSSRSAFHRNWDSIFSLEC